MMGATVVVALCCVLKMCVIVQGLYLVEVRLLGYENPTGKCQDCWKRFNGQWRWRCCDDFERSNQCTDGDRECDSYFIYCLRPFQTRDSREGGCSNSDKTVTSTVNTDDGMIDFSQSEVLGLNNPFQLQGLTEDYEGVQLFIEIHDHDVGSDNRWGANTPDEFIDTIMIDHNRAVGIPQRLDQGGTYGFVTMDLNITVFCVENFAEPDCSQCVPGFIGPDCKTNINDCLSNPCAPHGKCLDGIASFMCNCEQGFTGELCQTLQLITVWEESVMEVVSVLME